MPDVNCTEPQMLKAVDGHLTTEALMLNRDGRTTIAGMTAQRWQEAYELQLSKSIENYDVNRKPEGKAMFSIVSTLGTMFRRRSSCSDLALFPFRFG